MKKPKKHNRKKYTLRKRLSSEDLVTIQITARLKKVPKGFKFTKALLENMVKTKASKSRGEWDGFKCVGCVAGPDPRGIELIITRWVNPERRGGGGAGWRAATSQDEAWGTLRHAIEAGRFHVQSLGSD